MKITIFIILFLSLLRAANVNSQTHGIETIPITIGDELPEYPLSNTLNGEMVGQKQKLTDFNSKILILDFWDFYCTSCINSWPKLLKLQHKYKDKIQIMLINTHEADTNKIKEFIAKKEKIYGYSMNLIMANGDTNLDHLFPHQTLPHLVWANKGKVKFITGGQELNETNINRMISGQDLQLNVKTDDYITLKPFRPLFINNNGVGKDNGSNAIYSTLINPYSPDISTVSYFGIKDGISFGYVSNHPIKNIIRMFSGRGQDRNGVPIHIPSAQTAIEMADSTRIVDALDGTRSNRFTVQLTAKGIISIEEIKKKLLLDVEQCFGVKTTREIRTKKCLVLSRNSIPITEYKKGERSVIINTTKLNLNKLTISELLTEFDSALKSFNVNLGKYPIIDETSFKGYLGEINIVETDMNDIQKVGNELRIHGIEFSLQDREVEILVIRDAK